MSRIQLSTAGMVILLVTAGSAQGPQFSGWSQPVNLGAPNSTGGDFFAGISKDGLSLYFTSSRTDLPDWQGGWDIYVAQRDRGTDPFGPPRNLGPTINTSADEGAPAFSRDGHRMYFSSTRTGGLGGNDIYVSHRRHTHDDFDWAPALNIGSAINTASNETNPSLFQDDDGAMTLYFDSNRPGGFGPFTDDGAHNGNDIYASVRLPDGTWSGAMLIGELSTTAADRQPVIRRDGLEIFFASDRDDSAALDLWVSTRPTTWDPWSTPVNVGAPVNGTANEAGPALSPDGQTLYFQSNRLGGRGAFDLYLATRERTTRRDPQ